MKRAKVLAFAIGVAAVLGASQAWAATQSVTANIAFDAPVTLNKTADINFGTMTALDASTYHITTANVVTTTIGTGAHLYGATNAGSITIAGPAADTLTISVGGYTASNGVTPSNASCAYNGGAQVTPCTYAAAVAPWAGKTLLVGVDVAADGTQAAGTAATPSFTVTVVAN
jgi:hypothetical protein